MLENHTAAGNVEGSEALSFFPCLCHMWAPRFKPRSICIRPLKELCGGCLLLLSLRGLDFRVPRAAERDSGSH